MVHKRAIINVFLAGLWINASEFFRNNVLLRSAWEDHFSKLGQVFPNGMVNGLIWVTWGFMFAWVLYALSRSNSFKMTILIGWVVGFLMMWLVLWNLLVLPLSILWYAVPLSLLETVVGTYIILRLSRFEKK